MKHGQFYVRNFDMGVEFILSEIFGVYSYLVKVRLEFIHEIR